MAWDIKFRLTAERREMRHDHRGDIGDLIVMLRRKEAIQSYINHCTYYAIFVFRLAPRFKTGPVVDYHESATEHHHINDRSTRQPDVRSDHHHIHIRCHRHAAIFEGIHAGEIRSRSCTEVT